VKLNDGLFRKQVGERQVDARAEHRIASGFDKIFGSRRNGDGCYAWHVALWLCGYRQSRPSRTIHSGVRDRARAEAIERQVRELAG